MSARPVQHLVDRWLCARLAAICDELAEAAFESVAERELVMLRQEQLVLRLVETAPYAVASILRLPNEVAP